LLRCSNFDSVAFKGDASYRGAILALSPSGFPKTAAQPSLAHAPFIILPNLHAHLAF
jgi:hypothetical protein